MTGDFAMQKLSDVIWKENGFDIKLRNYNYFDEEEYALIKHTLTENSELWKKTGNVPVEEVVALMALVDQLAGGNRFHDEETALRVEDACIEIQEIIIDLL